MRKDKLAGLTIEKLIALYIIEKKSLGDIGKLYGASRAAIYKKIKKFNIKQRSKSQARLEAQKQGKLPQKYFHINENFFSIWSPKMAYVLGLMMTDGCISKVKNGSYRISLCLNDKELLEKVTQAMGSEHNVVPSKYQKGLYIFIIGRKKMAHDLINLGVKPRKSLDLKFPYVPKEYLRDFIRGVFDGDGCVYYLKGNKTKLLATSFVSGSGKFIYDLEKALQHLGMPPKKIYEIQRKNTYYTLRYHHKQSMRLFRIMYENLQNNLCLKRKYDKFKRVIG